ncbi:MAG TPA: class I SAM-dependent DNA methyltransferase [Leptospiraceae bacterium]|nr:class I SAM-dependent DNA methyltransferase [Leptospiraceae bacterium]HRG74308.1 class I SAM-dependent DNA methyltransferase [Leptospiraceae bacterium]
MDHKVHNQIVSFIWTIADDVLRDVYTRGKYRDIILPFTVLRRLDLLLISSKEKVLETNALLEKQKTKDKSILTHPKNGSGYPFYNTSEFTMSDSSPEDAKYRYYSLLENYEQIDSNLALYLDGFSANVQTIIDMFKLRDQLKTLKGRGLTRHLIEKFSSKEINLSPHESKNSAGEKLPGLENIGMGYVFEELIRKFNEENNEEAGEHFTPREIIKLMTFILFIPVKDVLKKGGRFSVYDPACGSGGMLTESEKYAAEITSGKCEIDLYGHEVNPETYAICAADMLIKNKDTNNIRWGSTLNQDDKIFLNEEFDFSLSNPPYGKSWKTEYEKIVGDKGKINDKRFTVGVPRSSDGQLLFLVDMLSKRKQENSKFGSRIGCIHNGSALFTGDAGSGESNIRKWIIENDWLECIVGLPKNMFYNTGISTYIFFLSTKKEPKRRGKVQLIDASEIYTKMRKSLGNKSYELTEDQIKQITKEYLDFKESPISKIFDNQDFGYNKITVERPLRLRSKFTKEKLESLLYVDAIQEEMSYVYKLCKEDVAKNIKANKTKIEAYLEEREIKLSPPLKKKLFDPDTYKKQKELHEAGLKLLKKFGDKEFDDFNLFESEVDKALKELSITLAASDKKKILLTVSEKDELAKPIIKKEEDGKIEYESDADLRDTENIPLKENIEAYFAREVLPHVPDAWIDHDKTVVGYEISFTKYFYNYKPLRSLTEIAKDILKLEKETEKALEKILGQ